MTLQIEDTIIYYSLVNIQKVTDLVVPSKISSKILLVFIIARVNILLNIKDPTRDGWLKIR